MKPLALSLLFLGAAGLVRADGPDLHSYGSLGLAFKKPQELPATVFNPFKAQTIESAMQKQESASVTNEAVTAAVGHRGISGLEYAPEKGINKVIIGDQIFTVGDELSFPGKENEDPDPLIAGATIVLREVKPQSLTFEITPEGETARLLAYPLRGFWRP